MKLAIVAGEASGDLHASEVVRELKKLDPALTTFGIGGDFLAREGMTLLHHAREMAIIGLFNVLRNIRFFKRVMRDLMEAIERERPDAVMLVDYPGFNMRAAKRIKALGIPVVYYISPQIWAWHQSRVRDIAKTVDRMIVIFPFEEEFYRKHDVPVTYVGHPLIEQVIGVKRATKKESVTRIALLPGSRKQEVKALLPAMLDAVEVLRVGAGSQPSHDALAHDAPGRLRAGPYTERKIEPYIVQAPTIEYAELEAIVKAKNAGVPILPHDRGEGIAAADVALSSSGTATLECAILGTPVVVMYRLSRMTHWLGQRLVRVPHFSLVNIIAGKEVVPELLQHDVNGERIAAETRKLLEPEYNRWVRDELAAVRTKLGEAGASRRAAEAVVSAVSR
ncbi:MAG TPA: lipid-A-disaccharide synthase [Thermoanaerobaculia bacterium]|nr:lipid-A-disaccharide synthase [Thermoanaerobaculia bacterium]